jgi:hypothetical protein
MSICHDSNKDHICDICKIELSKCTDTNKDYLCDICEKKLPYISVTVPEDCLVNNYQKDEQYIIGASLIIQLLYTGSDDCQVVEWIVTNSKGDEVARILPLEIYTIKDGGEYYANPVFE